MVEGEWQRTKAHTPRSLAAASILASDTRADPVDQGGEARRHAIAYPDIR